MTINVKHFPIKSKQKCSPTGNRRKQTVNARKGWEMSASSDWQPTLALINISISVIVCFIGNATYDSTQEWPIKINGTTTMSLYMLKHCIELRGTAKSGDPFHITLCHLICCYHSNIDWFRFQFRWLTVLGYVQRKTFMVKKDFTHTICCLLKPRKHIYFEHITKVIQSFMTTTASLVSTNLDTPLLHRSYTVHCPCHFPSVHSEHSKHPWALSHIEPYLSLRLKVAVFVQTSPTAEPVLNVCWNRFHNDIAWPTVAEEQDDVLGPVIPRVEFQRSIQCRPRLSIPVRWLLLKFIECCSMETHREWDECVGGVWTDMRWPQRFWKVEDKACVWCSLLSMCVAFACVER